MIGKSVEMLTNTIAEIRTYGEGFIIVDQSPSSVDIAAIKNTNTKIVLRTPEANDREAVGRSVGLTEDQVNEIAKLPSGVAVVYQNDWINPVLTMINKANIIDSPYVYKSRTEIKPIKEARSELICMLMQPWIKRKKIEESSLRAALKVLNISRDIKNRISSLIEEYDLYGGIMVWKTQDISILQKLVQAVIGIDDKAFIKIEGSKELKALVKNKLRSFSDDEFDSICYILTAKGEIQ